MDIILIIGIIVAVLIAGVAVLFLFRKQRSMRLRERFGPEYERSVAQRDDRRLAESELRERERRHRELPIRPLHDDERAEFGGRWTAVQQGFVDDPGRAVHDADVLVDDVMRARGYPLDDFDQRAADISVEHPVVVDRYREARVIADASAAGRAGTEELRQAVTSYRALIAALLEPDRRQPDPRSHPEGEYRDRREPAPTIDAHRETRR